MPIRKYDYRRPDEVRAFSQEIARLTASGPIGSAQAERAIQELSTTEDGRQLLTKARQLAKIGAEAMGVSFNSVNIYTDSDPSSAKHTLVSQAFSTSNDILLSDSTNATEANVSATIISHELTHVVQQLNAKGVK